LEEDKTEGFCFLEDEIGKLSLGEENGIEDC
jgi:hypothetical protein